MPRLLPLAAIGSLVLFAFQCDQPRYDGPDIDFGPGAGITYRDAQGRLLRPEDPTDWTSDATWNEQELSHFAFPNLVLNGSQQLGAVSQSLAYPNPGPAGQVKWHFRLSPAAPCPCRVYAQLVSKRYTEVDLYTAELAAGDSLQFAPKSYDPNSYTGSTTSFLTIPACFTRATATCALHPKKAGAPASASTPAF